MVTYQPLRPQYETDYYHPHFTGGNETLRNEEMFSSPPAKYVAGPGFELMFPCTIGGPEVKVRLQWGTW